MLRVLINCPGGWSHGLDSPERGEGRWAQNLARCLAKSGRYDVSACSGGVPTWGRGDRVENVVILSEQEAARRGPYDLYFDAAWYDKKVPAAEATHNFHVHFGYEPRLGVLFPERHYLVYVLRNSRANYFREGRENANRTFYLPAPFGDTLGVPDPTKRTVVSTMRGPDVTGRTARFDRLYGVVTELREGQEIPFIWISSAEVEKSRHSQDRVLEMTQAWGVPYNEIRGMLRGSGLNAALDGWSSILDATVLGIPSLAWEGGIDPTVGEVAKAYDLFLVSDSDRKQIGSVVDRLFSDAQLYVNYTCALQQAYVDHVEPRTLALFDEIVNKVMVTK